MGPGLKGSNATALHIALKWFANFFPMCLLMVSHGKLGQLISREEKRDNCQDILAKMWHAYVHAFPSETPNCELMGYVFLFQNGKSLVVTEVLLLPRQRDADLTSSFWVPRED